MSQLSQLIYTVIVIAQLMASTFGATTVESKIGTFTDVYTKMSRLASTIMDFLRR